MKSVKPATTLEEGVKNMVEAMIEDYNETGYGTDTPDNYKVREGRKYFKVVRENSVTAFVLKEDYKHFKKGDVLKAARWNAPALNRARGNVFEGLYPMQWTGPLYLN